MADLSNLKASLRGEIVTPEEDEERYKELRFDKTWSRLVALRNAPMGFCLVKGVHDIVRCVNFCRGNHIPMTIRGKGGHSPWGIANDHMCIDLSQMDQVLVDPKEKIVRVQAGATGRDVDDETSLFNLVCVTGSVSHTGFAGVALGGGIGHVSRWLGALCDSILEIEMVTLAGEVIRVNKDSHPDLFWAMRGAGGGTYGVVTEIVVKLVDMPNNGMIYGAPILWPVVKAEEVFAEYLKNIGEPARKNTETKQFGFMFAPDGSEVCGFIPVIVGESEADAKAICDELASSGGGAVVRQDQVLPYVALQQVMDAGFPFGGNYYDKGVFIDYDPNNNDHIDGLVKILVETWQRKPASSIKEKTVILCMEISGAVHDADASSTAFAGRDGRLWVVAICAWENEGDYESNKVAGATWAYEMASKLGPYHSQDYINGALPVTEGELESVYPQLNRLKQLKAQYDPEHLFTAGSWNIKLNQVDA